MGTLILNDIQTATTGLRSGYASELTPRWLGDAFLPKFAIVVWLQGIKEEAKGSSKMGHHFEKPFQPIRVVLLIANGDPLSRPPFSRQNCVQSMEVTHISPRGTGGCTLNAAQVTLCGSTAIIVVVPTNGDTDTKWYTNCYNRWHSVIWQLWL